MLDRRVGPWVESGLSRIGTRLAGAPNAHLHRIRTLLNELGVAVTPAAEALRLGVDGHAEPTANQTPAKLSHESVAFKIVFNMLQTDLSEVIAMDVEGDSDVRYWCTTWVVHGMLLVPTLRWISSRLRITMWSEMWSWNLCQFCSRVFYIYIYIIFFSSTA